MTVEGKKTQLRELARSQARLMESIAKYNAFFSGDTTEGYGRAATLSQIRESHRKYTGFGETGELVLAEKKNNLIIFLLFARKDAAYRIPDPVELNSGIAVPMSLALHGKSGIIEALDYLGVEVLAAYEHLNFLDMGLVAKMDMSEIQAPFITAILYTILASFGLILIGTFLSRKIVSPLIKQVYNFTSELQSREEELIRANFLAESALDITKSGYWHVSFEDSGWYTSSDRTIAIFGDFPRPDYRYHTKDDLYANMKLADVKAAEIAWNKFVAIREGERSEFDVTFATKRPVDGEIVWIHALGHVIKDDRDETIALFGVVQDITEKRKIKAEQYELREKLERAKRMESLGLLAGGVAHDLNNIIGPIMAYPELIKMNLSEGKPVDEDLDAISSSAHRAADVVSDLLALTRRGKYKMESIVLNDFINDYLNSAESKTAEKLFPQVKLNIQLSKDRLLIKASKAHIPKVIMNLVNNAYESMPLGGVLSITSSSVDIKSEKLSDKSIAPGMYNLLTIEDQGEGIEEENVSKIFDPFFTTKMRSEKSGTGLGLSVVYNVLKDHGAHIHVESKLGFGTKFSIYFPATSEEIETSSELKQKKRNSGSILVVDDRKEQRNIAERLLTTLGYDVVTVEKGQDAIEYIKKKDVDLALLDMILEDDMDGLDTYKEIIKIKPGQKTIIVSGYSESDRVKEAEELGVNGFIKKPYTMDDIKKILLKVLVDGEIDSSKNPD